MKIKMLLITGLCGLLALSTTYAASTTKGLGDESLGALNPVLAQNDEPTENSDNNNVGDMPQDNNQDNNNGAANNHSSDMNMGNDDMNADTATGGDDDY